MFEVVLYAKSIGAEDWHKEVLGSLTCRWLG